MILGLGTDIVENDRIASAFEKYGERFLARIFTKEETEYALSHKDPVPHLAARFAVKEAAIKALNIREASGLHMTDFEVAGKIFGKKELVFHRDARRLIAERGVTRVHLSLSHTEKVSMAVVILEGDPENALMR